MESVTIIIRTENAAFSPDPNVEVGRILVDLGWQFQRGYAQVNVRDINGNHVGEVVIR